MNAPIESLLRQRGRHDSSKVTMVELFFDLVFVVAVGRAAAALHHQLGAEHVGDALIGFGTMFFALWWAWMNFTPSTGRNFQWGYAHVVVFAAHSVLLDLVESRALRRGPRSSSGMDRPRVRYRRVTSSGTSLLDRLSRGLNARTALMPSMRSSS